MELCLSASVVWIWSFEVSPCCDGFARSKCSNSMRLGSISLPWCVQRAEIILALGGFSSLVDDSAVVFKSLQNVEPGKFKGYLALYAL